MISDWPFVCAYDVMCACVPLCRHSLTSLPLTSSLYILSSNESEWWGAGMVICLERVADLHMAQLMPVPLTVSCFSKIQIGFTFLVPAYPGSPEKGP